MQFCNPGNPKGGHGPMPPLLNTPLLVADNHSHIGFCCRRSNFGRFTTACCFRERNIPPTNPNSNIKPNPDRGPDNNNNNNNNNNNSNNNNSSNSNDNAPESRVNLAASTFVFFWVKNWPEGDRRKFV